MAYCVHIGLASHLRDLERKVRLLLKWLCTNPLSKLRRLLPRKSPFSASVDVELPHFSQMVEDSPNGPPRQHTPGAASSVTSSNEQNMDTSLLHGLSSGSSNELSTEPSNTSLLHGLSFALWVGIVMCVLTAWPLHLLHTEATPYPTLHGAFGVQSRTLL